MKQIIKNICIFSLIIIVGYLHQSCSDMERETEFDIYEYPDITVSNYNPKSGRPTVDVTITGTNFGEFADAAKVYFNGVLTPQIVSYSDTEMIVKVPENAGDGPIVVNVWTHSVELGEFDYVPGSSITSISPTFGKAGDTITIQGENFGDNPSTVSVLIGETESKVISVTDNEIKFILPDATSGLVYVVVDLQVIEGEFFLIGEKKLSGTIIGHEGSWNNNSDATIDAAFDGDISTSVDAPTATGFVGYDLGAGIKAELTRVRYVPREDPHPKRMLNGEFRGSNDSTLTDYDVLYTIEEIPAEGVYTEINITSTNSYRYIYYYAPQGFCNVAELEFYGIYK